MKIKSIICYVSVILLTISSFLVVTPSIVSYAKGVDVFPLLFFGMAKGIKITIGALTATKGHVEVGRKLIHPI